MSLRDMLNTILREKLYAYLRQGILREWDASVIYKLVGETLKENAEDIDNYLQNYTVTLESMNQHAETIVRGILLPSVMRKRIE